MTRPTNIIIKYFLFVVYQMFVSFRGGFARVPGVNIRLSIDNYNLNNFHVEDIFRLHKVEFIST